ncbi:hypothetical protein [Larkinella rosea]|uniref:DUF2281 domain-containing protein n=1 Tax=Larkinella rosea TaxID=2025312 RepID=A0A3P1BMN3_9BACT|nr:hypothetical protein [Larkinella rosea]RRB02163.1 hypothetical protein EHT25_16910 [Larkinella rosea]
MSRTEVIIQEINTLNSDELEVVYRELLKRLNRIGRIKTTLTKFRGKGENVWAQDAQEHINKLREDDRF